VDVIHQARNTGSDARVGVGSIAEHWAARDDLGLLLQLGAIAVPARPTPPE
jgi:hypothetical protein